MVDQERTTPEATRDNASKPVPVMLCDEAESPEGMAFDVEKGAVLPDFG